MAVMRLDGKAHCAAVGHFQRVRDAADQGSSALAEAA
jgi:hypothetical protein